MRALVSLSMIVLGLVASNAPSRAGNNVIGGLVLPSGSVTCHRDLSSDKRPFGFVLLGDGRHLVWSQGQKRDWEMGVRQARRYDGDLLLFRIDERYWLVRDARTIGAASLLMRDRETLAKEDAECADREAELANGEARLADEEARLADRLMSIADRRMGLAERRSTAGPAERKRLDEQGARLDAEEAKIADQKKDLARLKRALAARKSELSEDRQREQRENDRRATEARDAIELIARESLRRGEAIHIR